MPFNGFNSSSFLSKSSEPYCDKGFSQSMNPTPLWPEMIMTSNLEHLAQGFVILTPRSESHLEIQRTLSQLLCSPCLQLLISSFLPLSLENPSHLLYPCALKTKLGRGISKG